MAAGDANRVWFPEMIAELTRVWSPEMTWEELAAFCERVTEQRRAIRQARGILPPLMRCRRCGSVSRTDITGVSVRSALFMLRKAGLVSGDELAALDKRWMKHRKATGVDAFGRARSSAEPGGEG
jgi:hypothetical protein